MLAVYSFEEFSFDACGILLGLNSRARYKIYMPRAIKQGVVIYQNMKAENAPGLKMIVCFKYGY